MTINNSSNKIKNLKRQFAIKSTVVSILITIVVVFATLIGFKIPWIYDMTADKIFTLSDQTNTVIANLSTPVQVYAVYPKGGEDPLISSLLMEYSKAGSMLSVEYIDPERDPAQLAAINPESNVINNGTIIVQAEDKIRYINSTDLFQTTQEGNTFWGESQITGAIRYVTAEYMPMIYFLEGHDEASILSTISQVQTTLESNVFSVKTLSLQKTGRVPEDASLLIVSSPKRDISEGEGGMLRDYLNSGGSIFFLVDAINSNSEILVNFNILLHELGIDITNNIIVEEDPYSFVSNNNLYLIPGYAYHQVTQSLAESKRYVVFPIAMGLHTLDVDPNQVIVEPLLASTQRSWMRTDMTIKSATKTENDVQGPIALAYAATKLNNSNKEVSKVIVIGNSSFIFNENLGSYANRDFFMSCVSWLTGGNKESSISPRVIGADKFIVRGSNFTRLVLVSLVFMPLIPFICAFLVWYFRRNQ